MKTKGLKMGWNDAFAAVELYGGNGLLSLLLRILSMVELSYRRLVWLNWLIPRVLLMHSERSGRHNEERYKHWCMIVGSVSKRGALVQREILKQIT